MRETMRETVRETMAGIRGKHLNGTTENNMDEKRIEEREENV